MATSKAIFVLSGFFFMLCSCLAHADEIDTTKLHIGGWEESPTTKSNTGAGEIDTTKPNTDIEAIRFLSNQQLQFQSGDAVRIIAFPDSGHVVSGDYFVNNDGYADLPLIGMVKVVHKTPKELEKFLTTQYLTFLPRQNIIVRLMYRTALLGGYVKPGIYWVDPNGSLWDALTQGGGTLREDGIPLVEWIHMDSERVVTRNIYKYFQSQQSLLSMGFKSGDQLTVTVLPKTYVLDYLKNYVFPFITVAASILVSYEALHYYNHP